MQQKDDRLLMQSRVITQIGAQDKWITYDPPQVPREGEEGGSMDMSGQDGQEREPEEDDTTLIVIEVYQRAIDAAVWRLLIGPGGAVNYLHGWMERHDIAQYLASGKQSLFNPRLEGEHEGDYKYNVTVRIRPEGLEPCLLRTGRQNVVPRTYVIKSDAPFQSDIIWLERVPEGLTIALMQRACEVARTHEATRGIAVNRSGCGIRVPLDRYEEIENLILEPTLATKRREDRTSTFYELSGVPWRVGPATVTKWLARMGWPAKVGRASTRRGVGQVWTLRAPPELGPPTVPIFAVGPNTMTIDLPRPRREPKATTIRVPQKQQGKHKNRKASEWAAQADAIPEGWARQPTPIPSWAAVVIGGRKGGGAAGKTGDNEALYRQETPVKTTTAAAVEQAASGIEGNTIQPMSQMAFAAMMQNFAEMMPTLQAMTNAWKQEDGFARFDKRKTEEEAEAARRHLLAAAPHTPNANTTRPGLQSSSGADGSPAGGTNNDVAGGSGSGTGSPGGGPEIGKDEEEPGKKGGGKKKDPRPGPY